jgi:hypothetical protein
MKSDPLDVGFRVCWQPSGCSLCFPTGQRLPAILSLVVLLAFVLVGCGGGGSGADDRPPSDKVAYTAWKEWTKFGRATVVYGAQANGYTNRYGVTERSEPLSSRVGEYWAACGRPEWNGSSGKPWSGAFVTWVMLQSGYGAAQFPREGRHGSYLSSLYDRQRASRSAPFVLHAPNEYSPKPGDLVCAGSAGPTWRHADPRTAQRRIDNTAAHCDIVTDVRGGYVHAVGGNVKDSVAMSLFPVDSRGRLMNVPGRPWLLVVEKRG